MTNRVGLTGTPNRIAAPGNAFVPAANTTTVRQEVRDGFGGGATDGANRLRGELRGGGDHVVGNDPVGRGALPAFDNANVHIDDLPQKEQLGVALWAQVKQNPLNAWPDAEWRRLTPAQKKAVFDVKDEVYRQMGVKTIAEVIEEAKAAPPNPFVVKPWAPKQPGIYAVHHMSGENVFNPDHADGKEDLEFTPATGYTDYVRDEHLHNYGTLIRSTFGGKGADTITTTEFEDLDTLQRLVDQELPGLGYKAYLVEGTDARGIDVGVLTKMPLWPGTTPHLITTPELNEQRGILKIELNVDGHHVVDESFHGKSMRDGEEEMKAKNKAIYKSWQDDRVATERADPNVAIIGTGDSNMKFYDTGHEQVMASVGIKRDPNAIGPGEVFDATATIPQRRAQGANDPLLPAGTHTFHGESDFLDRIMANRIAERALVPNSVVVIPHVDRFFDKHNQPIPQGTSDHRSMVAQFRVADFGPAAG